MHFSVHTLKALPIPLRFIKNQLKREEYHLYLITLSKSRKNIV